MKNCLKCNKEFEAKRESAKFCSTSCRVMYNRSNPGSKKASLLDKLLERQEEMSATLFKIHSLVVLAPPQTQYDAPKPPATFKGDEPLSFDRLKQEASDKDSYESFAQALHAARNQQELEKVGGNIKGSDLLWQEKNRLQQLGQQIFNDKFNF